MNNTSEKQCSPEIRNSTDKLETLDVISVPSTGNTIEDNTSLFTNSNKYDTNPASTIIMKIDYTSSVSSNRDNSIITTSDCSTNDDATADFKSTTEIIDLENKKTSLNSSDVVLVEDYEKSIEDSRNSNASSKKILEISANSDVHIIESPDKTISLKSPNDSVQIVTSDPDTSIVLNNSDVPKPSEVNALKKLVSEDATKFISPVYADSKNSIERICFESQPAYSTPNEDKPPSKPEVGVSSTESITSLPPIYKKIGFYVEFSAAIHMSKDVWTGEMINMCFDTITSESLQLPPRLSDTSGNLADVSKSVSPASSSSVVQVPLKLNRISMASLSSSSSGLSSASTLAKKLNENRFLHRTKKDEIKLSEQNINVLYEKWANSSDICNKFLAYIDKNILNADSFINDDSLKDKPVVPVLEEQKVTKEVKEPLEKIEEVATPVSTNKVRQTRGKRQAKVKFTTDSENEIPKKRQRRVESCEVPIISSNFHDGDNVFAKWGDRKFYAATLGTMNPDGKWEVNFFDGDKKTLLEEFLIKGEDYTTMVGSNVYASQGDDNFTPGIITGFDVKDGVLQYIVVRDKGDISVPCQFIYITESQARQIRAKTVNVVKNPVKTNENVVSSVSKRSTRSKTKLLLDSPKPSVSGTQQTVHSDSDDDEKDDNSEINTEDVAGVEPESQGVYENGIKLKGKTLTGKMRFARSNKVNDTDATVLGPVPEEGSKYFKNFHVLLTCTRPQSPKLPVSSGNSSSTASENENYNFSAVPFVKDRLKLQLQMGGATVYNNFDDIPSKLWKHTYLISNRPNNSAKYIQCLAAGIKILCHEWVIRCCVEKKKVQLQELPLGWSVERDRYFNFYDKKYSNSLKKMNLLIADTGDKNFIKFWTKICKLADININKLSRDSNLESVTAVVSESGFKDEHIERIMSHNIPIVTTAWIIQSLLHGEPRQFDAHKSYVTEYVDSD